MAYIITKDHLFLDGITESSSVGIYGPSDFDGSKDLVKEKGVHFRMYDDDGELYYEGYFWPHCESSDNFEPLFAFGAPNAGCTEIHYRNVKTNKYERI